MATMQDYNTEDDMRCRGGSRDVSTIHAVNKICNEQNSKINYQVNWNGSQAEKEMLSKYTHLQTIALGQDKEATGEAND